MNIVEIPKDGYRDVVSSMRALADDIEAGLYGTVNSVVTVVTTYDDQEIEVFGWGKASSPEVATILSAGQLKVLDLLFPRQE